MSDTVKDLLKFIQLGARSDLKTVAVEYILGLTGTEKGIKSLIKHPAVLVSLIALLDDNSGTVAKDSALSLVNLSAHPQAAEKLLAASTAPLEKPNLPTLAKPPENIVKTCLKFIFDKTSKLADPCCMILSNLTRQFSLCEKIIDLIQSSGTSFDDIIIIFTKKKYSDVANLHYLGPFLSNLSQSSRVRKMILDKDRCVIQRLLPYTEYKESLIRRGGVIGTLKNCCFENDYHEWLLSPDVDILPRLLLPLAGNEEFDEEDNDKLPLELQYLPADKVREEDPDIRCMLLATVAHLCSTRKNREFVRDKNTYVILRELHKWEKDEEAKLTCEELVQILIRTEDEIGVDNLKEVVVPKVHKKVCGEEIVKD